MQNIKQQLERNKRELINHPALKFANDAIVLQAIRTGTKGYEGENLLDWYNKSLKALITTLIEEEEKEMKDIPNDSRTYEEDYGWNYAKDSTISRLKEVLKLIEE